MQGTSYPSGTAFIDAQGTMLNHALPGMPTVLTETPTDMVWWSDVIHPAHMLPARWTLNEQAAVHQGFNDPVVRVGTDGIAFASQARVFAAAGATLEQLLARPRLRFLDGLAVFRALADEAGVELVESDKGAYARLAVELWGELRSLINDLQPGPTRQLLDAWQSDEPSGKKPGNRIGDRRFLSIDDMINVLNASPLPGAENMAPSGGNRADVARDFTDRMLQQHVLRRGQCLMCTTCRHFGWYDADDVGQSFRCPRCRTTAVVDSRASKSSTPEIACYYQLHEAVHQALRHNFAIPMLATGQLTSQAHSTLWMSEHQVRFPAADNRPVPHGIDPQ